MNRDAVIALAREAGLVYFCVDGWTSPTPENKHAEGVDQEALERFAALVAAHEREECAKLCDDRVVAYRYATDHWAQEHIDEARHLAAAIRSRT